MGLVRRLASEVGRNGLHDMEKIVVTSVGTTRIENRCEALFADQAVAFVMDATHAFEYSGEAMPVSDLDEANSNVQFNAPKAAFLDERVSEGIAKLKCHGGEAVETFTPTCDACDTIKIKGAAYERMSGMSRAAGWSPCHASPVMCHRKCPLHRRSRLVRATGHGQGNYTTLGCTPSESAPIGKRDAVSRRRTGVEFADRWRAMDLRSYAWWSKASRCDRKNKRRTPPIAERPQQRARLPAAVVRAQSPVHI